MSVRILVGDVRAKLAELPDESVHCVVTSPPYFGLRDYGTAQWDGGDPACSHAPERTPRTERAAGALTGSTAYVAAQEPTYRHICGKCGATRIDNQIGLEPTLAEYIDTMTAVFRDVRRVLRSDGVCFLNIGDSYVSSAAAGFRPGSGRADGIVDQRGQRNRNGTSEATLKAKDLMMVPARLALALQADGWWLRSDCIWHKPNPMPESVTDRPTNAHEHIFLLTKSARYFYDADAVRQPYSGPMYEGRDNGAILNGDRGDRGRTIGMTDPNGANLRNVWSISTVGYPGAHFATFPPEIPRRCIKAGTSEKGACSACGAPWSRVVDITPTTPKVAGKNIHNADRNDKGRTYFVGGSSVTTGWQPGCTCDADVIPCTVMDIFFGSGTTGLVADQLGRDCIGIELNPEYARLAENRIRDASPMFAQVTA